MIFTIRDLIPDAHGSTQNAAGMWVRAMHLPFYDGLLARVGNAWAVLKGDAVAVRWPKHGEFEQAIAMRDRL